MIDRQRGLPGAESAAQGLRAVGRVARRWPRWAGVPAGPPASRPGSALAPCDPGEYYWTDLEGMEVVTTDGVTLGQVDHLFETGGHDVMVVEGDRQRLIPFVQDKVVQDVKFEQRLIVVDWDPTY